MTENIFAGLNKRQKLFATEYAKTQNATQSAISAGYSPLHATQSGWQLLHQNPKVKRAIEALRQEQDRQQLAQLRLGATEAHEFLMRIINDPNTDIGSRIQSAKHVMDSRP